MIVREYQSCIDAILEMFRICSIHNCTDASQGGQRYSKRDEVLNRDIVSLDGYVSKRLYRIYAMDTMSMMSED